MLSVLSRVQDIVLSKHKPGILPYELSEIESAIKEITHIDQIEILEFDIPDSPIIGSYQKYEMQSAVYGQQQTKVDVSYSGRLNTCWRRFVICKELCHSLDLNNDSHITNSDDIDGLVEWLISPEDAAKTLSFTEAAHSESIAKFAALELLCPMSDRIKVVEHRRDNDLSDMQIATAFRVPVRYVTFAFTERYIDAAEQIINAAR